MAITVTDLGSTAQTGDQIDYTFGSFSPTAETWLCIDVMPTIGAGTPDTPVLSGGGLTYNSEANVRPPGGSAALARIVRFLAWTGTSPGTFSILVDMTNTHAGCAFHICQVTGADFADVTVQTSTNTGTSGSATLTLGSAPVSGNTLINTALNGGATLTAGTGHTELRESSGDPANNLAATEWFTGAPPPPQTPDYTWTGGGNWAFVSTEIRADTGGGGGGAVVDPFGMMGFFGA